MTTPYPYQILGKEKSTYKFERSSKGALGITVDLSYRPRRPKAL